MSFYIMISSMMHIEQQMGPIIKSLFLIVVDIQRKTRTYNTLGKNFYCMCDHANNVFGSPIIESFKPKKILSRINLT